MLDACERDSMPSYQLVSLEVWSQLFLGEQKPDDVAEDLVALRTP